MIFYKLIQLQLTNKLIIKNVSINFNICKNLIKKKG